MKNLKNKQGIHIGIFITICILSFMMDTVCIYAAQECGVIDMVHKEQMQAQNFNLEESEIDNITAKEMLEKSKLEAYTIENHREINNIHMDTSHIKYKEGVYPIYFFTDKGTRVKVFVHVLASKTSIHIKQQKLYSQQASFMMKFGLLIMLGIFIIRIHNIKNLVNNIIKHKKAGK